MNRHNSSSTVGDAKFRRFHAMALNGDPTAQTLVGLYYKVGRHGVTENHSSAVHWFEKAANQDHAVAQAELGDCYKHGHGVEQDHKMAVQWYQKAADQDDADAQAKLGDCYYFGKGLEQDYKMAVHWFQNAANQGHAFAQWSLGRCYSLGLGLENDDKMAFDWFQKAVPFAHAQWCLGICHFNGYGVKQDFAKGVQWFQKAADQNCAGAQYNLGECYLEGTGCRQNLNQAHQWLLKAVENGSTDAEALAQQVAQLLSKPAIPPKTTSDECPVCYDSFGPNQLPIMANCKGRHVYCIKCIRTLMIGPNPRCGQCRVDLVDLGQLQLADLGEEEKLDNEEVPKESAGNQSED